MLNLPQIKNIIFDMGGVLVDFNPQRALKRRFARKEDRDILMKELFLHPDWKEFDRGIYDVQSLSRRVAARTPAHLHKPTLTMLENWADEMPPITSVYPLVEELKQKGYGIYLLSNAPENFYTYQNRIPAFDFFDGFIVSADHKCLKPQEQIYQILFETYDLLPEECFFIDDLPENIAGGQALGMRGHCFDHQDPGILRQALKAENIL
ncbi:MAG: HAD family phosphatase [Clostridiales bacterium]|nr:HAD family phosphatase [Clostridiales bacterium]